MHDPRLKPALGLDWETAVRDNCIMRILLAEDSPVYQRLISGYLKEWGFSLQLARNGTEACQLLEHPDAPALALLDWVLPGMSGLELCRTIRSRSANEQSECGAARDGRDGKG